MASNKCRAGFFDLPLEIRQLIYEEIFPVSKVVDLSKSASSLERNIEHLCQSDPRVRDEILHWESERYKQARFVITPRVWQQPARFRYPNLEWITIGVEHYEMGQPNQEIQAQLAIMRVNLKRFVAAVATFNRQNRAPPNIAVKFRESFRTPFKGDLHWCKPLDWDESVTGDLLATIDGSAGSETIFTYLLKPLLKLPVCQKARIIGLSHLCGFGVDLDDPNHTRLEQKELVHDHWCSESFCEMMEAWLEGRVSRDDPFAEKWNEYRSAKLRSPAGVFLKSIRPKLLHIKAPKW